MTEKITKTELARKLGVTKSRVTQLCRAGLPVWILSTRYTKRKGRPSPPLWRQVQAQIRNEEML